MLEKTFYHLLLFVARKDGISYAELSAKLSRNFPKEDPKILIQQALDQAILVLCPLGRKALEAYFDV